MDPMIEEPSFSHLSLGESLFTNHGRDERRDGSYTCILYDRLQLSRHASQTSAWLLCKVVMIHDTKLTVLKKPKRSGDLVFGL